MTSHRNIAFDLRSELFQLLAKFKALDQLAAFSGNVDADEVGQLDQAACDLARVYNSLPDVFIAAARD